MLEPLLVRLGSAEGEAGDVARLFRGFHSLKGLARAMALYGMEAVAHRAENLLGLVRDGGVAMTEPMLDGLLEAVDSLKGLRDAADREPRRQRPHRPRCCRSSMRCSRRRAAPRRRRPSRRRPPPAAPNSTEDGEMLDLFVELLQTRLPELARAFDADEGRRAATSSTRWTRSNMPPA